MTRRNRQSHRTIVRLPLETLTMLAPSITPLHRAMIGDGFSLQGSSSIHRAPHGAMTARLVYRPGQRASTVQSIVITVRNIVLDSQALPEPETARVF